MQALQWLHAISYFFGGMLLANAVPHLVHGISGRAFQTPFAKPPGEGLSSSTLNVLWAFFNLAVGYWLVFHVGYFDLHSARHVGVAGLGGLALALMMARHFGRFHGGNHPPKVGPPH